MTEELKGPKNPSAEVKSGAVRWVEVVVGDQSPVDRAHRVMPARSTYDSPTAGMWVEDVLLVSAPRSEHSETAELDAAVIEAAERCFAMGMVYQDKAMEVLEAAVTARRKNLAPPSLEEEIKAELELLAKSSENATIGKAAVDVSLKHILALVEAHRLDDN